MTLIGPLYTWGPDHLGWILWIVVPGAVVLLDDYAWATHRAQKEALDAFAAAHGAMILSLPTGQGLLIR